MLIKRLISCRFISELDQFNQRWSRIKNNGYSRNNNNRNNPNKCNNSKVHFLQTTLSIQHKYYLQITLSPDSVYTNQANFCPIKTKNTKQKSIHFLIQIISLRKAHYVINVYFTSISMAISVTLFRQHTHTNTKQKIYLVSRFCLYYFVYYLYYCYHTYCLLAGRKKNPNISPKTYKFPFSIKEHYAHCCMDKK